MVLTRTIGMAVRARRVARFSSDNATPELQLHGEN
jgi:hypothetical protein